MSHKIGEVHDGAAVMDYMEQEQERGITITAAATTCFLEGNGQGLSRAPHQHHRYALGHVDFTIEVERSLRVLDSAIAVYCAVSGRAAAIRDGLAPDEQIWRAAHRVRQQNGSRRRQLRALHRTDSQPFARQCGCHSIARSVPRMASSVWVDLVKMKSIFWDEETQGMKFEYREIPPDMRAQCEEWRGKMIEAAAEGDETLLNKYLEGGELSDEEIKKGSASARHQERDLLGDLRLSLQEQGRASGAGCRG